MVDQEKEMTFLDHLEELRWHLFRSLIAMGAFAIIFFTNRKWIMDNIVLAPFDPKFPLHRALCALNDSLCIESINVTFLAITPYEIFLKSITLSFLGGFIIAFPYVLWEIWSFIKPGLHVHERKGLRGNILIMSLLFFIGVSFSYYVILPFSIQFLSSFTLAEGIENQWRIGSVISLVAQISISGGIVFEMPILVFYLSKLGVIGPEFMKTYRRHAYVILLILAAIVTPPDVLSQILIFIPLAGLYELSIGVSKSVVKKEAARLAAEKTLVATE